MIEHKNAARASFRPFDIPTIALTSGGLGFLRPAPGTWGSLPPVMVASILVWLQLDRLNIALVLVAFAIASTAACVVWGDYAEKRFGRKDAAEVVADETAGVSLPALAAIILFDTEPLAHAALVAAFILFRLFDISKPWPMKLLEELPAGWGVVVDDLAAGVYSALIIMATAWLLI
ncbi:MAG: phosphatidylglycerophosphatase A [Gammaproteobacteria bacterium]|nr:phosphatidylglycerophosphatase A [Gammaproteobacteria bacterium]NNM20104.1 phosphatidylglycerophosphatase A [Gammaproteobacteria bacterium]